MSKTRWIIFAVICALLLGGLVLLAQKDKKDVSNVEANSIIASKDGEVGDHVYGNKAAKVIVYEYGDFQCPSCGAAYPQIKALKETYKDKIAFVFRNFPLTSIHPNALSASAAAEAAALQGKYWEMHDQLYENQGSWSSASTSTRDGIFEQYASAIGLNIEQYKKDLVGKTVSDKIARDRALAKKLALDSTPSIMIGSERMTTETIQSVVNGDGAKLREVIDRELKAAGVEPPRVTTSPEAQ